MRSLYEMIDQGMTWEEAQQRIGELRREDEEARRRCYTYTLTNSLTGLVFYVGKGTGNRMDQHVYLAKIGDVAPRYDMIRQILANGGTIMAKKDRDNLTSEEAFSREHELIAHYGIKNLTNCPYPPPQSKKETVIPHAISLEKAFREEMDALVIACMELEGIEPSHRTCYPYLQEICKKAIREEVARVLAQNKQEG